MALPAGFVRDGGLPSGFERDKRSRTGKYLYPDREDFPEHPSLTNLEPQEALKVARGQGDLVPRDADPASSLGTDKFGNTTITMNGQQYYLNKPGRSLSDIGPAVSRVAGAVEEAAPYLHTGIGSAPLSWGRAALAQAATGLIEESADQAGNVMRGEDVDWAMLATTPVVAAGGEIGGRVIASALTPVLRRVIGNRVNANFKIMNDDGTLTDDAIKAIQDSKTTPTELDSIMAKYLRESDVIDDAQANRFSLFKKYFDPTRAQVTRNADDFALQQELAKQSGPVRTALEDQDALLRGAFRQHMTGTGGTAEHARSPIHEALKGKATFLDDQISSFYKAADDVARGNAVVDVDSYVNELRRAWGNDKLSGGLMRAAKSDLMNKGIIDNKWKVLRKIDPREAEQLRIYLNQRYKSTSDIGRIYIRQLKDMIDADVGRAVGDDVYNMARAAKRDFHQGLATQKVSRFDQNSKSLVQDILDNNIQADDLFKKVVTGKAWHAKDLSELRTYLLRGTDDQIQAGGRAWLDLQAETVDHIIKKAFSGPVGEDGVTQALSKSGLDNVIESIGKRKLKAIFSNDPTILRFLEEIQEIATLRQPVRGTGIGYGPSAQAIQRMAKRYAGKVPFLGEFLDQMVEDSAGRLALRSTVPGTARAIRSGQNAQIRGAVRAPSAAIGSAGWNKYLEGQQ